MIINKHIEELNKHLEELKGEEFNKFSNKLVESLKTKTLIVCGNSGSCAIAQHWVTDFLKGCFNTKFPPKVISIADNVPLITAISNDISYDDVFSFQLRNLVRNEDPNNYALLVISSSGNSPNIINVLKESNILTIESFALVGFDGGIASTIADNFYHVKCKEYEVTEDIHHIIMHIIKKIIIDF